MSTPIPRKPKLQRQKTCGGLGYESSSRSIITSAAQGLSTDSQQSTKSCLALPSSSLVTTPLLRHHVSVEGACTGSTSHSHRSDTKREIFKWSGVTVSFDADSVTIENEVNGSVPGLKSLGKEVQSTTFIGTLISYVVEKFSISR